MTMDSAQAKQISPRSSILQYTEREHSILCLIAEGLTNAQVARKLLISRHTVAQHIAVMLRAAGARSRAELVARAYSDGILRAGIWPPEPRPARPQLVDTRQ
jgi:DNA-binding NarL/FixJ family response regulator